MVHTGVSFRPIIMTLRRLAFAARLRLAALSLWAGRNAPALVASAGFAATFAGLWIWLGPGQALTAVGGFTVACVSLTYLRGGYG